MCGCNQNGLTNCGCEDNCPNKTSELTFDGVLNNIAVPEGATLNDVLLLLEEHSTNLFNAVNLSYNLGAGNCIGLAAGTYSFNQIFDALIAKVCECCACKDFEATILSLGGNEYSVSVSGGTAPYTYLWVNKSSTSMFNILSQDEQIMNIATVEPYIKDRMGLIEVTVTDANGCKAKDTFLVLDFADIIEA
jgi:hypothetical protein